jgi:hypothetical protein
MAMGSPSASHLLSFMLPGGAAAIRAPAAGWSFGCMVEIGRILVQILGPSREAVFEVAGLVLRQACDDLPPQAIAARLYTLPPEQRADGRDWLHVSTPHGAADGWTIITGADVAFSPTALDPYFPKAAAAAPVAAQVKRAR